MRLSKVVSAAMIVGALGFGPSVPAGPSRPPTRLRQHR